MVGIVIVNYRTAALVVDCLRSLASDSPAIPRTCVVVDNASGDDSLTVLQTAIAHEGWTWVRVVAHPHNNGFAAGNNVGLRALPPADYYWLLNPDTIVRPDALAALVQFMEQQPHVGVVGSRLENPDGTPQTSAFRFHSWMGELENNLRLGIITRALEYFRVPMRPREQPHRADWVSGASLLLRRAILDDVGFMDEGYFLYYEETDYCLQIARAGWPIWHVPASRVVHLEGQSTGVTGNHTPPKRRPRYWFDSRARYFRKNHGATYALLADLIFMSCFAVWRLHRWLRRKPDPDPPSFLGDFVRHAWRRWW